MGLVSSQHNREGQADHEVPSCTLSQGRAWRSHARREYSSLFFSQLCCWLTILSLTVSKVNGQPDDNENEEEPEAPPLSRKEQSAVKVVSQSVIDVLLSLLYVLLLFSPGAHRGIGGQVTGYVDSLSLSISLSTVCLSYFSPYSCRPGDRARCG